MLLKMWDLNHNYLHGIPKVIEHILIDCECSDCGLIQINWWHTRKDIKTVLDYVL